MAEPANQLNNLANYCRQFCRQIPISTSDSILSLNNSLYFILFLSYLQLNLAVPGRGVDEAHWVGHAPVPVLQLHRVHRVTRLVLGKLLPQLVGGEVLDDLVDDDGLGGAVDLEDDGLGVGVGRGGAGLAEAEGLQLVADRVGDGADGGPGHRYP